MAHILGIVAPVFLLIALGWGASRRGLVDPAGIRGLLDFTFYAAMPALLFGSIADAPPVRLVNVAGSFLAGAVALFFVLLPVGRRLLRLERAPAGMFALNSIYGNTVMMGVPLIQAAYGPEGVANLLAVVAFHSATLLPLGAVVVESGLGMRPGLAQTLRSVLRGMFTNPVVVSVLVAVVWRVLDVPMPFALKSLTSLLGGAAPPVALFCLGASLPRGGIGGSIAEIGIATLVKLVVMPALVGAIAFAVGVRGVAFSTVVVAAGMPTGANAFLLARKLGASTESAAGVVLVATICSVITLTGLLSWLP